MEIPGDDIADRAGSPRRPAGPTPGARSTTSTPQPPRPFAEASLQRIASLYEIEHRARGRPPDERRRLRQAEASPRLAELHAWLDQQCARLPSSSKLAGALRCSLKRWPALTRYADAGRLEIESPSKKLSTYPRRSCLWTTRSPSAATAAWTWNRFFARLSPTTTSSCIPLPRQDVSQRNSSEPGSVEVVHTIVLHPRLANPNLLAR